MQKYGILKKCGFYSATLYIDFNHCSLLHKKYMTHKSKINPATLVQKSDTLF